MTQQGGMIAVRPATARRTRTGGDGETPAPRERLDLEGPKRLRSTWHILPGERAKRPGAVTVTDPSGAVIATIDPVTRERRDTTSGAVTVLLGAGWNLGVTYAHHGPAPAIEPRRAGRLPDYSRSLKDDRDPRR